MVTLFLTWSATVGTGHQVLRSVSFLVEACIPKAEITVWWCRNTLLIFCNRCRGGWGVQQCSAALGFWGYCPHTTILLPTLGSNSSNHSSSTTTTTPIRWLRVRRVVTLVGWYVCLLRLLLLCWWRLIMMWIGTTVTSLTTCRKKSFSLLITQTTKLCMIILYK